MSDDDVREVDKELEDIHENEVKYDSDGVARGVSPGRPPSSAGSVGSSGSKGKRRTWKKPKDKPKRPLSAYNIFFKHFRSRIVEGLQEDSTAEETIRSVENILSTSRETRRHRKTHGRISFGDLARKIADKWKGIGAEQKAVFEHYAEIDMRRYRKEVKIWKEKKEAEALGGKGSAHDSSMSGSISSADSESEFSLDHLTSQSTNDAFAPRRNFYDSMSSSFSSSGSIDSDASLEPIPIGTMLRNARPNMHMSMPNINFSMDTAIPGYVQGEFQSNPGHMGQPIMQFGEQSLTNVHLGSQGVEMDGLNASSNQMNNSFDIQRLQQHNSIQQQQLQQQQHILLRQQELLQQQLQQNSQNMMQQPSLPQVDAFQYDYQLQQEQQQRQQQQQQQQQQQVFPDDGDDIGNYLSNLDLSNV